MAGRFTAVVPRDTLPWLLTARSSSVAHEHGSLTDKSAFSSGSRFVCRHRQDRVIAANRRFHNQIAQKYDRHESCAFQPYWQEMLEKDLETIQSCVSSPGRVLQCLDCGGGTGNFALKMLARGSRVTVVDASEEMLAVLQQKARAAGHSPRLVHSSIECFLEETCAPFDIVAFSSVLHHLYDYTSVVQQAAAGLASWGNPLHESGSGRPETSGFN